MRALKVVVIVMAVGLVAGFTALFVQWSGKMADPGAGAAVAPSGKAPADAVVPIPPGGRVVQVAPGDGLVDVLVENPDGTRDLLQVRRADGAVAGILRFRPDPP